MIDISIVDFSKPSNSEKLVNKILSQAKKKDKSVAVILTKNGFCPNAEGISYQPVTDEFYVKCRYIGEGKVNGEICSKSSSFKKCFKYLGH